MLTSYHVHTDWSDGTDSPTDMINAARACGIVEIGFADHCEAVDAESRRWCKSLVSEDVPSYIAAIEACARASRDVLVRRGLEVEWFPEDGRKIGELLERNHLDFVIGSIHHIGFLALYDEQSEHLNSTKGAARKLIEEYWRLVRLAAESGLFDVIGHLDYFKVGGQLSASAPSLAASCALDAIERAGIAIELNVSGWKAPCREAFPSDDLLKECNRRRIPVVLSSDAHSARGIVDGVVAGGRKLREVGYSDTCGFCERRRYGIALPPKEIQAHTVAPSDGFMRG